MAEEAFTEPEPNVITSSVGWTVQVLGRTGMRFTEAGRSVWIDSEVLAAPRGIAMYPESMKVWEPTADIVQSEERARIVDNISRAFAACGYELEVAPPFDWDSLAIRPPEDQR